MSIHKDYTLRLCSCFAWLRPDNMPRCDKRRLRKDWKDQKCRTGMRGGNAKLIRGVYN